MNPAGARVERLAARFGLLATMVVSHLISNVFLIGVSADGQTSISGDWPVVGHDNGGARYSPLTQITDQRFIEVPAPRAKNSG